MSTRKGGLGRGLDALIPTSVMPSEIKTSTGVVTANRDEIDLSNISANPKQPRTVFDEDQLTELALSIKEVGLLQPPVVRSVGNGKYQLIMGERRFRAAKLAGLKSIPVIIRQTTADKLLREAMIENLHRSQLNPLEEGAAYQQLLNDFSYTHDELAAKLSKSRPAITNT
ncbi:MAG: ParB/RepB/Spo0J family partition protein, partial [Candidatus Nanopelagicus sp.]